MTQRKPYPTDLTDQQWQVLAPLIPASKPNGRPISVEIRGIINAIFYILASGCAWRMMPHDFPPWQTVLRGVASENGKNCTLSTLAKT